MIQRILGLRIWIRAKISQSVQTIGIEVKPITIRRIDTRFQHMMKLPETAAGMIEHAIRHNADVARVRRIDEFTESRITAQQRIDIQIIVSVITMIRRRSKNRIEVNG